MNNMVYDIDAKIPFKRNILFALQQVMSIIVGTILLPVVADASGVYLSQSSALIGAGVGTIIYLLLTRFKSPVCIGSSFSFVAPIMSALTFGYFGVFIGTIMAGAVYVILAILIKFVGIEWINKVMPPVVIGPVVALIGFTLAGNAISDLMNITGGIENYNILSIVIGLATFFVTILVSVKGGKKLQLYPFLLGILFGYIVSAFLSMFGYIFDVQILKIIDFSLFSKIADFNNWLPNITIIGVFQEGFSKITSFGNIVTIFTAFVPIAFVSFAEHIADHKNLSSIVGKDLLKEPGLVRTLLGDGIGSMVGAFFCGIPNTTYGESIGCVALSKNASTKTIFLAAIMCIVIAFIYPIILFVETIPSCVIAGICIALYGFISVSGLRMLKEVDINDNKNMFVVASIFITGIGGLFLKFGAVEISNIACALLVGILANVLLTTRKKLKISQKPNILENKDTIPKQDEKVIKDNLQENVIKENIHQTDEQSKKLE